MRIRAIAAGSLALEETSSRRRVGRVDGSLIHVSSEHGQAFGKCNASAGAGGVVWVVAERGELVVDVEGS